VPSQDNPPSAASEPGGLSRPEPRESRPDPTQRPATAARMYDYFLGGYNNFPADREAAQAVIAQLPDMPMIARANRNFLARAVRYLVDAGIQQFIDIGSGLPTVGNVHEIAQAAAADARVVYVDIDPAAVSESLKLLATNPHATAVRGDLRTPQAILDNPTVRSMLDLTQPVAVVLATVLHFVPDDVQARDIVAQLTAAVAAGSHIAISHGAAETFPLAAEPAAAAADVYRRQTATPGKPRSRADVHQLLTGLQIVPPGVTWIHTWRADPLQPPPAELAADPTRSGMWAAVATKI
jgi:hypothetical protein